MTHIPGDMVTVYSEVDSILVVHHVFAVASIGACVLAKVHLTSDTLNGLMRLKCIR